MTPATLKQSEAHSRWHAAARSGMTLIEMLIATTITLIIMGIVAQLFSVLGRSVSDNRTATTMSEQLRGVAQMLRKDLAGLTVATLPPVRPESDSGYLEIIEGVATDASAGVAALTADFDDVIMFTTKSFGQPFVGVFDSTSSIESQYAEVAWFCAPSVDQPLAGVTLYTLYRRQLLSMAYVGAGQFLSGSNAYPWPGSWADFYAKFDLSCRKEGLLLYPNSLGDLTKRENRFLHGTSFPFPFLAGGTNGLLLTGTNRVGNDIVLTNVVGFDVRVFDSSAPIRWNTAVGNVGLVPGDPDYFNLNATNTGATGAYVDLGWGEGIPQSIASQFPPTVQTAMQFGGVMTTSNLPLARPTYDTWSLHYEFDGIDQNGNVLVDEGTNGQDDNGDGVADEAAEAETSPPYPYPLRGIEVRIRCYEPSSRQVRQITVRNTFVPH